MRVIFVDDEQRVLDGISRVLYSLKCDWDVQFVTSGAQALDVLAAEPVEVIVSDMRMPGMTGAELLERVQAEWPSTLRIMLTGQIDRSEALRVFNAAHQLLSKPIHVRLYPRRTG